MVFGQILKSYRPQINIKFPVKIKDIHKPEKKNSIDIRVLGYENKEKYSICDLCIKTKMLQRKIC